MKKLIPLLLLAACSKPYDPASGIETSLDLISSIEQDARDRPRTDRELIHDLREGIKEDCRKLWEQQRDHPACR